MELKSPRRIATTIISICITSLLAYIILIGSLVSAQRQFIFPVPKTAIVTPDIPRFEKTTIRTSDGLDLVTWHVAPTPGYPVIIYFHGNGEQLSSGVGLFKKFAAAGYGLVAIDYRGYGGSPGTPSETGLVADGMAAWEFATNMYGSERTVVWGYSLGTGVAVAVSSKRNVAAVVLEAAFSSALDVASDKIWFAPIQFMMIDRFHSDHNISTVRAPILFMHGDEDETIPMKFGKRLFELANEPKTFETIIGSDHYSLDNFGATNNAFKFIRKNVMHDTSSSDDQSEEQLK